MSSVTHKKLNQEEMIVEAGLLSAFNAVVQQSSEKIYLVCYGVMIQNKTDSFYVDNDLLSLLPFTRLDTASHKRILKQFL